MSELAWAAGFFDGEGYIGAVHVNTQKGKYKGNWTLQLSISQCDPYVLHRFREAVGGIGRITGPYSRKLPKRGNDRWVYRTNASQVEQVMDQIKPYLSPVKLAQLEKALEVKSYSHL
jgi:hypothetical protein